MSIAEVGVDWNAHEDSQWDQGYDQGYSDGADDGHAAGYLLALEDVVKETARTFPMDLASRRLVATVLRRVAAENA